MLKAFRDTWELGIHSYLTYLRDRALLASKLLAESGSFFLQISDENVHLVRNVLDDVFGPHNFVAQIVVQKTGGLGGTGLKSVADYLIWYAKSKPRLKYRQLFQPKVAGIGESTGARYDQIQLAVSQARRALSRAEREDKLLIPEGSRFYQTI
jgi:adenine-specific DNA-methyltransferase